MANIFIKLFLFLTTVDEHVVHMGTPYEWGLIGTQLMGLRI